MTIRKRIERLEIKRGLGAPEGPLVIFLCDAETGEPRSALIVGGGSIPREPGEPREAFKARAMAVNPAAQSLPDNGRDALATGKTPPSARPPLIMQALGEKHASSR
jgi:hypothetical protein